MSGFLPRRARAPLAVAALALLLVPLVVAVLRLTADPVRRLLRDVPASADTVVVVDLIPSLRQARAFHAFAQGSSGLSPDGLVMEALKSAGLDDVLTAALARHVRPAAVFFGKLDTGAAASIGGVVALDDPAPVRAALGKPMRSGNLVYYASGQAKFAFAGERLAVAAEVGTLREILAADRGARNFTQKPGYAAARARFGADANFWVLTMGALKLPGAHMAQTGWSCASATVEADGLRIGVEAAGAGAWLNGVGVGAGSLVRRVPSGVYALLATVNPVQLARRLGAPADTFEKTSSVVRHQVAAGFAFGLYAAKTPGGGAGFDVLALARGDASARPAAAGKALVEGLLGSMHASSSKKLLVPVRVPGADSAATLFEPLRKTLVLGAGENPDAPFLKPLVAGKTLTYACVGRTLIVATSSKLLARAVRSLKTGAGSAAAEPAFKNLRSFLAPDTVASFQVATRLAGPIRGLLKASDDASARAALASIARWPGALGIRFARNGSADSLEAFVPLDYASLGAMLRRAMGR